jgi:hypothetical protein
MLCFVGCLWGFSLSPRLHKATRKRRVVPFKRQQSIEYLTKSNDVEQQIEQSVSTKKLVLAPDLGLVVKLWHIAIASLLNFVFLYVTTKKVFYGDFILASEHQKQ